MIWKEYGYSQSIARRALVKHGVPIRDKVRAKEEKKADHKFVPQKKNKIIEDDMDKEPIDCNTQGRKCIFKARVSGGELICDYLCKVGHMRGCDPHQCTKYIIQNGKRGRKKHG